MDFATLNTVAEPSSIEDAYVRFPKVPFAPTPWNNPDPCSGCPDGPWDVPESELLLVYRWWGHWIEQPVCSGCLEEELLCLTRSEAASDVTVQVLVFSELKVI